MKSLLNRKVARLGFLLATSIAMVGGTAQVSVAKTVKAPKVVVKHDNALIPLYDNASPANWKAACSQVNGDHGGSYVIADVDAGLGAGPAPMANWKSVIGNCSKYGNASVIGYVWTNYGRDGVPSIKGIEAQVNDWYRFYRGKIAGIFFDGVSDSVPETGASNQSFYQTLAAYVHKTQGNDNEVVYNYGANPASGWMFDSTRANNANMVVIFEGTYNTPGQNPYVDWTPAPWEANYPVKDFAALIYNAPDSSSCATLLQQHLGYVYVGTWYDQLPPFFSTFVKQC